MTPRVFMVSLFLAGSLFAREEGFDFPREKTALFASAGASLMGATGGLKIRAANARSEFGIRYAYLPQIQSMDGRINVFAENLQPQERGTFYGGPEFLYVDENTPTGHWNQAYLTGMIGREHQIRPGIRFAYEGGAGIMVYSDRAAMLPFGGTVRAELLFQVR